MYKSLLEKHGSIRKAAKSIALTKAKFVRLYKIELGLCQRTTSCLNKPEEGKTGCRQHLDYVSKTQDKEKKKECGIRWNEDNKEYRASYNSSYQKQNLDKFRAAGKRYRQTEKGKLTGRRHRERRLANSDFVLSLFDIDFLTSNMGYCVKTGTREALTMDHHIPLSKGGKLTYDNTVFLTKVENSRKQDRPPNEFYSEEELSKIEAYFVKTKAFMNVKSPKEYVVEAFEDKSKCENFISTYHYLHRASKSIYAFVLKYLDRVIGVCLFSSPTSISDNGSIELSRLFIFDGTPKNTESYFVSRCLKWLSNNTKYAKVVSYSDPLFGHKGIIYKACNFEFLGETPGAGYIYKDLEGNIFNKRAIYYNAKKFGITEREVAEIEGFVKVKSPSKFKYVYHLKDSK